MGGLEAMGFSRDPSWGGPICLHLLVDLSPFVDASHAESVFVRGVWSSWVLSLLI